MELHKDISHINANLLLDIAMLINIEQNKRNKIKCQYLTNKHKCTRTEKKTEWFIRFKEKNLILEKKMAATTTDNHLALSNEYIYIYIYMYMYKRKNRLGRSHINIISFINEHLN